VRTRGSIESLYARSKVVLACRMASVASLDQVVLEFRDPERFIEDAAVGLALGYEGKICINPSQVPLAHQCFSPSLERVERSRRMLAVYEAAGREGIGVIEFEGQMIDEPMVRQARRAVAITDALERRGAAEQP
jgi:citrate lyase subunit beta/citryl-CoA lyase